LPVDERLALVDFIRESIRENADGLPGGHASAAAAIRYQHLIDGADVDNARHLDRTMCRTANGTAPSVVR
jgi:hypothetical protein